MQVKETANNLPEMVRKKYVENQRPNIINALVQISSEAAIPVLREFVQSEAGGLGIWYAKAKLIELTVVDPEIRLSKLRELLHAQGIDQSGKDEIMKVLRGIMKK